MPGSFSNPVCALLGPIFYHLFTVIRCGNPIVYPKQHDKPMLGFPGQIKANSGIILLMVTTNTN